MSARPVLLQNGRLLSSLEADLEHEFEYLPLWKQQDPVGYLREHGGRVAALATSAAVGADEALLASLPNLQMIGSFGVGYDQLPTEAIRRRGLKVSYTPDVLNDCVADTAFALLLDVARGVSAADRFVRRGEWRKTRFPLATSVAGKRLGIFGLGRIGKAIAQRALGFGLEIRYTSRNPVAGVDWGHEPSLVELARWADFLVIAAAGGLDTRKLVNAEVMDALGPEGFLVNVARGTVVDEAALVDALSERRIAGAGLDVFEDEPNVPEALLSLENVVLLPHIASATNETRQKMGDLVLANVRAHFAGKPLLTPIPGVSA